MLIYLDLDGLDDVTEDAFKAESGKTNVSLTIASVAAKQRISALTGLAHEITGVKVVQKKGKQTVSLTLAKKEKKIWHKLLDEASTKEAVADDTANNNTSITSRVRQKRVCTVAQCGKRTEGFLNGTAELLSPNTFLSEFTDLKFVLRKRNSCHCECAVHECAEKLCVRNGVHLHIPLRS